MQTPDVISDELTVEQANAMIDKFMGLPAAVGKKKYWLQYHFDWNALKGVVDKVGDIAEYHQGETWNEIYKRAGSVLSSHICISIETLYNRVIEFIIWYNTQQQNITDGK